MMKTSERLTNVSLEIADISKDLCKEKLDLQKPKETIKALDQAWAIGALEMQLCSLIELAKLLQEKNL